ncbi:MAG: bifunctional 23S rRNA (guanine(2069)-N(7))-methyltransferase RlmK/23S rRNA (guanine(2445)-N(2))-methyltransferase RlmL [Halioglobus sp.]
MSDVQASQWYAACPRGIEGLLFAELDTLGATAVRETVGGVYFDGPLAIAYRACLWSRLANRVILPLASFDVSDAASLYQGVYSINWGEVFSAKETLAVDFSGENKEIRNTQFGAQKSKDAIVDWFQAHVGERPSVARKDPDIRLNIRLSKGKTHVGLDFSGGSLHRRNYRLQAGEAPLKENLAAALLLRADWPGMAARGGALLDPMCGAATLLLEAAMMAADIAPGLQREQFGFERWRGHNPQQWHALLADARTRAAQGRARQLPEMRGYDANPEVIRRAQENIAKAGLGKSVRVSVKPLAELTRPTHMSMPTGLIICNPPYGERLGEKRSLVYLYQQLGELMSREFSGWHAAIFTSEKELGRAIGLRSHKQYSLYNGTLPATLYLFELNNNVFKARYAAPDVGAVGKGQSPDLAANPDASLLDPKELSPGAQMFANRLRKNRRRLASWVKREAIQCYRLYDADMPEYAVAVDLYGDQVHVAEYQAPRDVPEESAARRLQEVMQAIPVALDVAPAAIVLKQRKRQRGNAQYERQGEHGELMSVSEGAARLLVNLRDYLDTGLFLDHRPLRLRLAAEARDKDFLNLFCYTGSATIHAALAGARSTTSVDLSNTYLGWLRKNLAHNGLDESKNEVVKADCLQWLTSSDRQFDLIMLDPPSFSNSAAMSDSFDVQRDHESLVTGAMLRLRPDGMLYFSTNKRGFKLANTVQSKYHCKDITSATLDPDFQRNQKIHTCWQISALDSQ